MEIDARKLYLCSYGQKVFDLPVVDYSDYEELYKQLQQLKAELQAYKDKVKPVNFVDSDEYLKVVVENKQLKAENEELRKSNTSNAKAFLKENKEKHKLLDCLDEIEEIATYCRNADTCYECDYFDNCDVTEEDGIPSRDVNKVILQLIKQAKEGK